MSEHISSREQALAALAGAQAEFTLAVAHHGLAVRLCQHAAVDPETYGSFSDALDIEIVLRREANQLSELVHKLESECE